MPGWRSPNQHKEAPPGEYVVRHERPYPERMERAFRIGAGATAVVSGSGAVALVLIAAPRIPPGVEGWLLVIITAIAAAALAYAAIWAIGAVLIGIVTAFRRKRYVVDWQDEPPAPR